MCNNKKVLDKINKKNSNIKTKLNYIHAQLYDSILKEILKKRLYLFSQDQIFSKIKIPFLFSFEFKVFSEIKIP